MRFLGCADLCFLCSIVSGVQVAVANSGTIAGRNVVSLTAENVNNLGGRIDGNDVSVAT